MFLQYLVHFSRQKRRRLLRSKERNQNIIATRKHDLARNLTMPKMRKRNVCMHLINLFINNELIPG
jgi:hypothetical protein